MGCFSAPEVNVSSPWSDYLKGYLVRPMVRDLAMQNFGSPLTFDAVPPFSGGALGPQEGTPSWVYPGQRVAPESPLQSGAFNWASQLPGQTQAMQGLGVSGIQKAMDPSALFGAPLAYTGALWNDVIAPSVMERFAGVDNAASSGAMNALARQGGITAMGLNAQLAPMALQGTLGGLSAVPSISGLSTDPLKTMGLFGEAQRGIGQEYLTSNMQKFYESSPYMSPQYNELIRMLQLAQGIRTEQPGGLGYSMLGPVGGAIGEEVGGAASNVLSYLPFFG